MAEENGYPQPPGQPSHPGHFTAPSQVYPQPMSQQVTNTTVVVTGQPTGGHPEKMPQNIREWSSGICGCFDDCGGCLFGCFCFEIFMCTLAARMGECCCVSCNPTGQVAMRTKVRAMYGIRGGICTDSICMSCCLPLAACQMKRELDYRGL